MTGGFGLWYSTTDLGLLEDRIGVRHEFDREGVPETYGVTLDLRLRSRRERYQVCE